MRLHRARVSMYRCIKDTGWFEVDDEKTILVGPNEAGKTAILQALQHINPPEGVPGFAALRDYPRSDLNNLDSGRQSPSRTTVAQADFLLDDEDRRLVGAIDESLTHCMYRAGRTLDNEFRDELLGIPEVPTVGAINKDLKRLAAHTQTTQALESLLVEHGKETRVVGEMAGSLRKWLEETALPNIDESDTKENERYDTLLQTVDTHERQARALTVLRKRLPRLVYYHNYFRVHPRIHLAHLAERTEQQLLDDDQYDYGNLCLLKLLGFTARQLSDLGKVGEPNKGDRASLAKYQDQLDERDYKLNAASVQLTKQIRQAWQPDPDKSEPSTLRLKVDQQYLKVVVEDELGVEVELDQRSEGFRWLVSFFIVFFAETQDTLRNAILLLDEPGLSLHGLKQREFRKTVSQLARGNQTLFTTHSPFMVGPDELDKVRVIELNDRRVGTELHTTVTADSPAALLPLQEALGYDLAQSLFAQQRNLVLEGLTDYWYVDATARMLADSGEAALKYNIALVPANTAGKVVYYATILHAHNLKVAALLDSDAAGEQAAKQEVLVHKLGNKRILRTLDAYGGSVPRPEIEDLLRDSLVAIAKNEFGWDVGATASSQPERPIVDIFREEVGKQFSKYRLAKAYLRWTRSHEADALTTSERKQWKQLIATINKVLK